MSTREHRVRTNLRSVGRFRRVNFGRNDTKMILKNPYYLRMLLRSRKEEGVKMTFEEYRKWLRGET